MLKTKPEILAVIPARGGSKSIPRKNLLVLAGKPLIAYSIIQAKASKNITRVIVSTDDPEIRDVSLQWGAEVPFLRPAELAADHSPDFVVFEHALQWLKENEGYECEAIVHLRPPGPLRSVALIDEAIERLLKCPEADSIRSVGNPLQTPYKMWTTKEDGFIRPILEIPGLPDAHSLPRQVLPPVLWQNGYVDVIRSSTILNKHSICGDIVLPFEIKNHPLEIDYPETVPVVEAALYKMERGEEFETGHQDNLERHPV